MDRLAYEASLAIKAGMTYGKWKAMQKPIMIEPPKRPKVQKCICAHCGDEYDRKDRPTSKYCSCECSTLAAQMKTRKKRKE